MADFIRPLPGPMYAGQIITVDGFIPAQSQKFSVNLSCAPTWLAGDVALHANVRFNEGNIVVLNSHKGGHWEAEERPRNPLPLQKNANFQCTITSFPDKLQLAFNGQLFAEFRHRIPQERVNHVIVSGDVQVFNVTFGSGSGMPQTGASTYPPPQPGFGQPPQPGFGQPSFGGYPPSGQPGGYPPPGQPGGYPGQPGQPPSGFSQPQVKNIPGGLYPGRMIYISATPNPGARSFTINLKNQEFGGDNYLHFDIRFSESAVVRNSLLNGAWGQEERQQPEFPFQPGQQFNLIILAEQGAFKVAVNNKHFIEFAHRNPNIQAIQWVETAGDASGVSVNMS